MKLAPLLLTTAFLLSGATFVNAQETKCTLKINQAPELRGFRLGMTMEQVRNRIPSFQVHRPDSFGLSYGHLDNNTLRRLDDATYRNVGDVYLSFFDDRLIDIRVSYYGVTWRNSEEFVAKINQAFKLPNAWEGDQTKTMQCDGWSVRSHASGSSASLTLSAPSVNQSVKRRREEYEEKQRQDFRP